MAISYNVGNTPLIKIREISEEFWLPNLFIKDESKNPFGTIKDRKSKAVINKALREKIHKIIIITSGNTGNSLARLSKGTGLKIICIISDKLKSSIKNELKKHCYKVIEVNLARKILSNSEIINLGRENSKEKIWNVDRGFHDSYQSIIGEIKKLKPNYIIVPIGSGESFVGLYNGIERHKLKTKLIGVTVKSKFQSYADKLYAIWAPYRYKIKEITNKGNKIIKISEKEVKESYNFAKRFIKCEPSSAVVFQALRKLKFVPTDKIVVINSGRGLF